MTVTVTKDDLKKVMASIKLLAKKRLMIGITEDKDTRKDGGMGNASIGYVMEHGSPAQNIPPRPFLVPTIEDMQKDIAVKLGKGAKAAMNGNAKAVVHTLESVGMTAQSAVKAVINDGDFEALAESTIKARARKNSRKQRGMSVEDQDAINAKPLNDTLQLRNSITYVVRDTK